MEVKVTLEAGQSLIDLVNTLLQGLSRQTITPAAAPIMFVGESREGESSALKEMKRQARKQTKAAHQEQAEEPITEPDLKTLSSEDVIDYTKLRAEIKAVASNKRAADSSVDIKGVFKKHGGTKLSEIADADLPAVMADIEAL